MQEIGFNSLLNKKVIYRVLGDFVLDLELFKKVDFENYELFIEKPLPYILILKKEQKELFGIESLKIINFEEIKNVSELRVCDLEKMCFVKGMVTKVTKVVAYVEESKWNCLRCGCIILTQKDKKPTGCSCGNKSKFSLESSLLRDLQEIEIEEPQDELEGKQPQKIRVRLFDELTDSKLSGILQPGNKISILGIAEKNEENKKSNVENIFEYRLLAFAVKALDEQFYEEIITDEDLIKIKELSKDKPLENLANSLAPSIFGNDEVKKTLILQMVGGVKKIKQGGIPSRERIHILLCGDPGVAKTFLGKSVAKNMPKSYYISGDSTTKAGLTAIVDRDVLTNSWCLKAGSLSKANDSILIIDELDKLSDEDRQSLHTPMESGEMVVNKADIHTTLRAECSILGIANPKNGMFEMESGNPITKQIDIPPPLMSRFDIIFVMTDQINKESDFSVVEIIYENKKIESTIDKETFRKYISYARKLKPTLKKDSLKLLQDFYHSVRLLSINKRGNLKGMPITPRHLEGIIRLAEASAKIRLSKVVKIEDVNIAKEIFYNSLMKLSMDEHGVFDVARIGHGRTLSKKQKSSLMQEIIHEMLEKLEGEYVYEKNFKEKCLERGIERWEFEDLLFELNKEGIILKKQGGWGVPNL